MPERPGYNPDDERDASLYPDYRADPLEHPFLTTEDESERHARYRMTARLSLDRVRAITDAPDSLADDLTRVHLATLRDELNRLDLDDPAAGAVH